LEKENWNRLVDFCDLDGNEIPKRIAQIVTLTPAFANNTSLVILLTSISYWNRSKAPNSKQRGTRILRVISRARATDLPIRALNLLNAYH